MIAIYLTSAIGSLSWILIYVHIPKKNSIHNTGHNIEILTTKKHLQESYLHNQGMNISMTTLKCSCSDLTDVTKIFSEMTWASWMLYK